MILTVPDAQECYYREHSYLIVVGECVSTKRVSYTDCEGACASNSRITMLPDPHISFNCGCCKPTAIEQNYIEMRCNNETRYLHPYYTIMNCECKECEFDPMETLVVNPYQL